MIELIQSKYGYALAASNPRNNSDAQNAKIFGIAYDKGQLEGLKPTNIQAYGTIQRSQAQLRAELEAMGYKIEDIEDEE